MSTNTAFWPEFRRAAAQWAGIVASSIVSGLLLGILLRRGVNERMALEIALLVGFALALVSWVWVALWFTTATVKAQVPVTVSRNVINIGGQPTAVSYTFQETVTSTMASQSPVVL